MSFEQGLLCKVCHGIVPRLVATTEGLKCEDCRGGHGEKVHMGIISRGHNPYNRKMTHADTMRIITRKKQKDGRVLPDKRWRKSEEDK